MERNEGLGTCSWCGEKGHDIQHCPKFSETCSYCGTHPSHRISACPVWQEKAKIGWIIVKSEDIDSKKIRKLNDGERERLERLFVVKLKDAGLLTHTNYEPYRWYSYNNVFGYYPTYRHEAYWESYEKAHEAVENLVEKLKTDIEIPEVHWIIDKKPEK